MDDLTAFIRARLADDEYGATAGDISPRARRELAAKRCILAIHHPVKHDYRTQVCNGCGYTGPLDEPYTDDINECPMLRLVAAVYSDHPDYRQEWKP